MEKLTITIDTGNSAFEDEPGTELARILRALADTAEQGDIQDCPIMDANGNRCGMVYIKLV